MWCLEHKSGPSLTTPCPPNSHNSWWASDLQRSPSILLPDLQRLLWAQSPFGCFFFLCFLCYLLPIWAKPCCTNLRAQHSSTSLGWWGAETAKHPTFASTKCLTCPLIPGSPSVLLATPVSIFCSVCPPAITNPSAALDSVDRLEVWQQPAPGRSMIEFPAPSSASQRAGRGRWESVRRYH